MNLLGFETSSAVGTVALKTQDGQWVREIATPREQTEKILGLADELFAEAKIGLADLDAITFGRGPGSFTGLRVSAAVAQGLSLASGIALVPVSSLLCLAERAAQSLGFERCVVCVDAHMGEVYWAETERRDGVVAVRGAERLAKPVEVSVPSWPPGWAAVGGGFAAHRDALSAVLAAATAVVPDLKPSAECLFPQAARDLAAGRTAKPGAALPVYLREHTAWRRSS